MTVYVVVIVYDDNSSYIDRVFSDFNAAENYRVQLRNDSRLLPYSHMAISYTYTSMGYEVH